jgi:hypothetical protein
MRKINGKQPNSPKSRRNKKRRETKRLLKSQPKMHDAACFEFQARE